MGKTPSVLILCVVSPPLIPGELPESLLSVSPLWAVSWGVLGLLPSIHECLWGTESSGSLQHAIREEGTMDRDYRARWDKAREKPC